MERLVGAGVVTEEAFVFGDGDVTQDGGLAGQAKTGLRIMRRKAKPPELRGGGIRDRSFDADRAGPAGAVTAAVDRASHPRVERKASPQQDDPEVGARRTLDRLTRKVDFRHSR